MFALLKYLIHTHLAVNCKLIENFEPYYRYAFRNYVENDNYVYDLYSNRTISTNKRTVQIEL
jgi:hypothetical protein